MNYLADTHALVWYFTNDSKLSKKALSILDNPENNIIIPTIVLAEIMFISRKERISVSFKETLKLLENNNKFTLVPLDLETLKIADEMIQDLEMHDKLIVATGLYYDTVIITKDSRIKNSKVARTIW